MVINFVINFCGFIFLSEEFLIMRCRVEKELKEIWYFVSVEVSVVNKFVFDNVKRKFCEMV